MSERLIDFLTYSAKCVTGTLIVLSVSKGFSSLTYSDTLWALFSVLLVLSPDGKDTVTLALTRIKANLLGAGVGFIFITLFPNDMNMWTISLVLFCTLGIGYLLKLDSTLRSALCAAIIITMPQHEVVSTTTPVARVISVIAGCLLGICITYVFHFKQRAVAGKPDDKPNE